MKWTKKKIIVSLVAVILTLMLFGLMWLGSWLNQQDVAKEPIKILVSYGSYVKVAVADGYELKGFDDYQVVHSEHHRPDFAPSYTIFELIKKERK